MKNKLTITILVIFIITYFICSFSYAASFSVASSVSSINVGGNYTVSVSAPGLTGKFSVSGNGNVSISTSSIWIEDGTLKEGGPITVTAKNAGTATVTLTATSVSDSDGNKVGGSQSTSITVTNPSSSSGGSTSSSGGGSSSSGSNTITSLTVGDKTYSNPNQDITVPTVDSTVENIVVKPTTSNGASYTINGGSSTTVPLKTGTNVITIVVSGGKTYKVRVTRLAQEGEVQPNIIDETEGQEQEVEKQEEQENKLTLTSLKVKNFELDPEFNSDVYSYTINIDMQEKNVDKLDVDAIPSASDATVEIIGNENLVEGENIITILVKSADGTESVVYQIIVNKNDASSEIVSASVLNNIGFLSNLNPFQKMLVMGFAGLVLIIVIVMIIILIRKNKKKKKAEIPYEGINEQEDIKEEIDFGTEEVAQEEQEASISEETMKKTELDDEKAKLMDEFFSYNQEDDDSIKETKKRNKGKGKHF